MEASPLRSFEINLLHRVEHVEGYMRGWPRQSVRAAKQMIDTYGKPNEATPSMLIWYENGPWVRTVVHKEAVPHNFPKPHMDVLEQAVPYRVPSDRVDEISEFDGSILIDRTRGEITAHCDSEEMNILALNLAHEIAVNRMTVDAARKKYSQVVAKRILNWPEPLMERLNFRVDRRLAENFTNDPDHMTTPIGRNR